MPGLPRLWAIGSTYSSAHSAGSASAAAQALPRTRVLPSGRLTTSSFNRYHVSFFHSNGFLMVRAGSICHEVISRRWLLPNKVN